MFGSPATGNIIRAIRDGNHERVAELLRDEPRTIHAASMRGESPLIEAAQAGEDRIVALLLAAGAPVDAVRMDGASALYVALAANRCSDATVAALLGAPRCDANARPSPESEAALDHASFHGRDAAVGLLLAAGARMTRLTMPRAAASGSVPVLRRLLAAGADVEGVGGAGDADPPLICAAARLHHDAVLLLLAHGADVNVRGRFVPSALVGAARAVVRLRRNARFPGAAPPPPPPPVLALLLSAGASDNVHDLDALLSGGAGELRQSRDALGGACFAVIRARAFEVLVALQDAALPAWISVVIVRAMGRNARLARLSSLWALCTAVKHFHSSASAAVP